jgi:hypothetical protein
VLLARRRILTPPRATQALIDSLVGFLRQAAASNLLPPGTAELTS